MRGIPGRRETYRNPKAARGLAAIQNIRKRHGDVSQSKIKKSDTGTYHTPKYIKAARRRGALRKETK